MPKPMTNAQRAFRKDYANMVANFRRDIDEHFALIGKATCALIERGEPVTDASIRAIIFELPEGRDAGLVKRATKHLDHTAPNN